MKWARTAATERAGTRRRCQVWPLRPLKLTQARGLVSPRLEESLLAFVLNRRLRVAAMVRSSLANRERDDALARQLALRRQLVVAIVLQWATESPLVAVSALALLAA